jgi:hypothetical protein
MSAEAYAGIYGQRRIRWITDQVHIKAIILGDPQELTFDVLNSIKYDAILGMPWLREKNPGSIGSAKNYTPRQMRMRSPNNRNELTRA